MTYSEYGIDNDALIAAYKKIKLKNSDSSKINFLNTKLKNIQYYRILFLDQNDSQIYF